MGYDYHGNNLIRAMESKIAIGFISDGSIGHICTITCVMNKSSLFKAFFFISTEGVKYFQSLSSKHKV